MPDETLRRGLANEGGFFSPYYLFDLLARRHGDELDLPGRDLNRPAVTRSFGADGDRPHHVVFFTVAGANITTITGEDRALGSGCGAGRGGVCADREGWDKDAAAAPQDEDAQAALRLQLKKLLAEDETLTAEVARLWEGAKAAGVTVTALGDRSVAVGGSVSGSVIVTGDRNMIQQTGKQSAAARSNSGDRSSRANGITLIPAEPSMARKR